MGTILPKRGRVHVGKRLEFVYKTVTIFQKFHGTENSHSREKVAGTPFVRGKTHYKITIYKK
jgi:hypothetical protein